jgi:hypothetical protein
MVMLSERDWYPAIFGKLMKKMKKANYRLPFPSFSYVDVVV